MLRCRGRVRTATVVLVALVCAGGAAAASAAPAKKAPISAAHARRMKADIESAMSAETSALANPDNFTASVRSSVTWLGKALKLGLGVDTGGAHFQLYRSLQFDRDALGTTTFAKNNRARWVQQALGYQRQALKDIAPFLG